MDPVILAATVSAAAKAVSHVSVSLYGFVQDNFIVDRTFQSFFHEVESLQRSIAQLNALVNTYLRDSAISAFGPTSRDEMLQVLWKLMAVSLDDCRVTFEKLNCVLQGIHESRGSQRWMQPGVQFILDLNSGKIALLRSQVRTHKSTAELAFLTINV